MDCRRRSRRTVPELAAEERIGVGKQAVTFLCALRDLQWRRRRVLIAAIGAALVFSITLVLAGVSHGFDVETNRTMDKFGADGWVVGSGASGPFIGQEPLPRDRRRGGPPSKPESPPRTRSSSRARRWGSARRRK